MGSLTRLQMRNKVFNLFGEVAGHITTGRVDEWLQEGYGEFASLSKSLVAYERFPVVEGVVTLPPGFNELVYIDSGSTVYWTEYEMVTGTLFLRASVNRELPTEVFMKYWASPSYAAGATFAQLATDASQTVLSETGDMSVVHYALSMALEADNRKGEAVSEFQKFRDGSTVEFERTVKLRAKPLIKTSAWTGKIKQIF